MTDSFSNLILFSLLSPLLGRLHCNNHRKGKRSKKLAQRIPLCYILYFLRKRQHQYEKPFRCSYCSKISMNQVKSMRTLSSKRTRTKRTSRSRSRNLSGAGAENLKIGSSGNSAYNQPSAAAALGRGGGGWVGKCPPSPSWSQVKQFVVQCCISGTQSNPDHCYFLPEPVKTWVGSSKTEMIFYFPDFANKNYKLKTLCSLWKNENCVLFNFFLCPVYCTAVPGTVALILEWTTRCLSWLTWRLRLVLAALSWKFGKFYPNNSADH